MNKARYLMKAVNIYISRYVKTILKLVKMSHRLCSVFTKDTVDLPERSVLTLYRIIPGNLKSDLGRPLMIRWLRLKNPAVA